MNAKAITLLVFSSIYIIFYTAESKPNKILQNLCYTVQTNESLQFIDNLELKPIGQDSSDLNKEDQHDNTDGNHPTDDSFTHYRNTRKDTKISRPNKWLWSRSLLAFLPLARRTFHRTYSSTNRLSTKPSTSNTHYYCTSDDNSVEIQCDYTNSDAQCCEYKTEPYCCGGEAPDNFVEGSNQAISTLRRIFYLLTVLALCIHLFLRYVHSE